MQVHATSDFPSAVIVDTDSLTRLWSHVEEYTGQVEATARCSDDIVRKFDSISSLLSFENSDRTKIKWLEIEGRSREKERTIGITIGRQYSAPASLVVRGEELDVSTMRTKVSDTIYGMKAWYSHVAKVDLFMVWGAIALVLVLLLQLMASTEPTPRPSRSFAEALKLLVQVIGIFSGIGLAIFLTARLRTRFFPLVSFATGQGVKRHQIDEQVRWTVLVGFVVGLAGSIAYSLLSGG